MVPAGLDGHFVGPAPHARMNESALYPGPSEFLTLRVKGKLDIRLVLRPVRSSDGEALQNYVRGLTWAFSGQVVRFIGTSKNSGGCFGIQGLSPTS